MQTQLKAFLAVAVSALVALLFTASHALAQAPVSIMGADTVTFPDGGIARRVAVDAQGRLILSPVTGACGTTTVQTVSRMDAGSQVVGVLYTGGGHPLSQYVIVCNSKDNASGLVRCRHDGVAPILDAGAPGTVLDVGDCVPYTSVAAGPAVRCIGVGNLVSIYECGP